MSDINLLPEELRSEEEKEAAKALRIEGIPVPQFHLPQEERPARRFGGPVSSISSIPQPLAAKPAPKENGGLVPAPQNEILPKEEPMVVAPLAEPGEIRPKAAKRKSQGLFGRLLSQGQAGKGKKNLNPEVLTTKEVDVNLIPAGFHLLPNKTIYTRLILSALAALLLVGLGLGGALLYGQKFKKQEKAVELELVGSQERFQALKIRERELTALNDRLFLIKDLFNQHIYWTKFFGILEKVTIPEVYYTNINAALDGSISLTATAESYLALARQYLAYQQATDVIKEVSVSGINGDPLDNQVNFTVELFFVPEAYLTVEVKK